MARLSAAELDLIKRYASHPNGLGYVADYSNQTFNIWFRDSFGVDIDDEKYQVNGSSKGNRLLSFCRQEDDAITLRLLKSLRIQERKLDIDKSEIVSLKDVKAFDELIDRLDGSNLNRDDEKVVGNATKGQIVRNAEQNRTSLLYVSATTVELLEDFKEKIRSDNFLAANHTDTRENLLTLLENLISEIQKLTGILTNGFAQLSESNGTEVASWTKRFIDGAIPELKKYFEPERLGSTSVPATVILSCAGIGALLTGFNPLGFGAGSYFGKLIVGEMKSGQMADQLAKHFSDNEQQ